METKELKIVAPEGYEIDRENSTLDHIKFKLIKKELTLVNILKHCPKGTKLYSPIYGDCELNEVNDPKDFNYPIVVNAPRRRCSFTKEGRFIASGNGECCLFPSKDQRDWSKFRLPCKRGDVMRTDNSVFIVYDVDENLYPKVYCSVSLNTGDLEINENPESSNPYTTSFYYPADAEVTEYLAEILDKAGYMWNPETLSVERSNIEELADTQDTVHCFKPFDKVLVSRCNSIWFPAFFWEMCDGYYRTIDGKIYEHCIPYEGNEALLGTSSK